MAQAAPAACCDPCPQPVCTTRYIQRCYYQPVTTYQTKTYYEPVTTYRTSYYYEPVTSYRYSCYVDPCTGCTQQVACPTTSYLLRAKCCPVQSWVQRCCSVPVTAYQRCCYWEPQTCCTTPAPCNGCSAPAAVQVPAVATPNPPVVQEQQQQYYQTPPQTPAPPTVEEKKSGGQVPINQYYPPPNGSGSSFGKPLPGGTLPARPVSPAPAPAVRPDRIASMPSAQVQGQVVRMDRTPRGGVHVLFVSTQPKGASQLVTANAAGQFQVNLTSGDWLVYVAGSDGRQVFHSRLEVNGSQPAPLTVVMR